ncbi:NAD-dependent epimerase/dehydratase family protein [Dermabacter vaginalis]|uniref:NAD-dependent epimerase/dehydratase family protein n=1 Tax=Dermabacter vaginalis TaxID=1630135 RepID=UPI001EF4E51E|nr:NAD-dependent epimerase/dehydratase family protein [Dermabacter vaginalis]MCG7443018.1 NAD-dependent epimerase/dehydratase family protein [Dermabacter vaginalis]
MSGKSQPNGPVDTLVLGGAGFAGSHIARELRTHGWNVSTADIRPSHEHGCHTTLDIRDERALRGKLRGCDTVVNAAGVPDPSSVSVRTLNSILVGGARSLIAAAESEGVRTLVFVSSGVVYGDTGEVSADETLPLAPTTAEGRAFAEAERLYGQWASAGEGRRLVVLRAAELFGPGSHARVSRVIASLVNSGMVSLTPTVIARPLASVGTLARAARAALELNPPTGEPYVLNVADSPRLDDHELRAVVRSIAKTAPLALSLPGRRLMARAGRAGEAVRASGLELPRRLERFALDARPSAELSREKLEALLPERPSLEESLRETVSWVRAHGMPSGPDHAIPIAERFVPSESEAEEDTRRVVAVVVTYNRAELLGVCLGALHSQTRPLDGVVIVDNASTDRSGAVADAHPIDADVVHLNRNVGGAGGFCTGMAHALLEHSPDFLWIMDDDTVPAPDALEKLLEVECKLDVHASVLSSLAVWTDGRPHPMNSSRTRLGTSDAELDRYAQLGARPIRTASFVSALIAAEDVWEHGLPIADYFIWSDDFEYTGRLLRDSHGFAVASSTVEHRTRKFSNAQTNPGSRFYFDVRNRLWALTKTESFTPIEKVLYGGKSALGWVQTLVRTRADVLPVAMKGMREGLFTSPRRSSVVLAADPMRATEIRALEASIDSAERSRRALT